MAGKKLTPKQAIFIEQYLVDTNANAKRAAIAAGVPETSAAVTASRWLKSAVVKAAIAERQAKLAEKFDVKIERTIRKLAEIGYGDLREMLDEDGNLLPVQRMSEAASTMIAGLEIETTDGPCRVRVVNQKVKLADRIRALELLGKYQKIFTDRVEHDGRVTLEQLVCGNGEKEEAA